MADMPFNAPAVVVGIDGSRAGIRAALWAVEEAVSRDVPLRLIAIAEGTAEDAHAAVQAATAAVDAAGRPVRIEIDVRSGSPTLALLEASRTAVMVCIGAVGLRHFTEHRIGSTATALVASAHSPVAVVRSRAGGAEPAAGGWVVVELDETPDSAAVLQAGVEQARLRSAPLRVLGTWQSRHTDAHDSHAVSEGNRLMRSQLDRRIDEWKRRYPDLDVEPVVVHGSTTDYLADNAASIQLVVVGSRNTDGVGELLGPAGVAALHDTDCSVLVVDPRRLL